MMRRGRKMGVGSNQSSSLALATLNPQPVFPELYQELDWYSGSYFSDQGATSAGANFLPKGQTGASGSAVTLHTLSSNWGTSTKYALELALWSAGAGASAYAQLYDVTAGAVVNGTQLSTTSTTPTVFRSGQVTLTPSHKYGVTVWTNSASYPSHSTDASLIVFPPSPLTSPSVSSISLANPSGNTLKEAYYPLWVYSSAISGAFTGTSSGAYFVGKNNSGGPYTSTNASTRLHTLNANWSTSQQFAFEASLYSASGGATASMALWDFTASAIVSASQISSTSASATVVRSGKFTLIPGHVYGITAWTTNGSYACYLTKAHLVALSST